MEKVKNLALSYYSRKDIQSAIYNFSINREVVPRYFESFGKRPDTLQYKSDILELAKKGTTSFHCSEELWQDPFEISTNLTPTQLNNLRLGWDLLIDIDSKYIDFSKIAAELIISALEFHNVKNVGLKYSVSGDTPIIIKCEEEIRLLPIREAIEIYKKNKKMKVLSMNKDKKIVFSEIYDYLKHKDSIYEIYHSQSKIPIKATKHHSVFIWSRGRIKEKKVKEIKKGDFLITFNTKKNPLATKITEVNNVFYFNKNQFSKNLETKKLKITPELMRLIGYFLAEGHVTNIINQVGFSFNKNEKEYIEDCKNLLFAVTGRKISVRHPNPNSTQILIHSKEWANFFDIYCGKKNNKHIPSFSWRLKKELFLEMLNGYIRGDGYKAGEYLIAIKSVSKQLITEFIWLCKLNGISCSLSWEQNKERLLPQGTKFKGGPVYMIKIPKSELPDEFMRNRNKFSPFPRDKTFPVDGLKEVYYQIKPKMFNYHRIEQMALKKKSANLKRIRKILDWFSEFRSKEPTPESKEILLNYESLFNSDVGVVEIKEIREKEIEEVFDVSVRESEAFFGNYYPILLHNSGNKGFHILVPWRSFPEQINNIKTKDMFPEWPRMITSYLTEMIKPELIEKISRTYSEKSYIKDFDAPKKVMPDIILVSPRHLFRMPYSLHEKTSLASVVINKDEISDFMPRDAEPFKASPKNFLPKARENEARELLLQVLDWHEQKNNEEKKEKIERKYGKINIDKRKIIYPPCIKKILNGMEDGRKRALFILLNLYSSLEFNREEMEEKIEEWNKRNPIPLKQGYIKGQINWTIRQKKMLPPNCDKDYYKGIGVCIPDETCKSIKNPLNYTIKKSRARFHSKSYLKNKK